MIRTITGALRAIKQARNLDELHVLKCRLLAIAWNDGGEVRNAIEARESELTVWRDDSEPEAP